MTKAKNIEASVRQRLLNLSKERGEDFGLVLSRFAIERLLYRVATSPHKDKFILKGATLFTVWSGTPHRATRDLDLLGFGDNSPDALARTFREICVVVTIQDGLRFDDKSVSAEPIREDNIYGGIRITMVAKLGTTRIPVQVDVGFGDDVVPNPTEVTLPALLEFPSPVLRAYAKETVVAEKFHAMVVLGMSNSRMKDFFDVAWLAKHFDFDEAILRSAIALNCPFLTTRLHLWKSYANMSLCLHIGTLFVLLPRATPQNLDRSARTWIHVRRMDSTLSRENKPLERYSCQTKHFGRRCKG